MVRKKPILNYPENKNNLKTTSILLIILFIILMFLSTIQITGCKNYLNSNADDENKVLTVNNLPADIALDYIQGEEIILPEPELKSAVSLEEALFTRRSIRDFNDKEIEINKISQLLWAAQGITENSRGFRTAPSAGALYPLEIFIVRKDGLYHYLPADNKLMKMDKGDLSQRLYEACIYQSAVAEGDINIIITAIYERTTAKYGDRGVRYVHLEAGHACQNILLEATSLDLGAVPVGAFDDAKINEIMGLPEAYIPLYVIPVGYPE